MIAGARETSLEVDDWRQVLDSPTVVARYRLDPEEWREEIAKPAIQAVRLRPGSSLVLVDEADVVAPLRESYPKPIQKLATMGRGERTTSIWVSQRPTLIDKSVYTQATKRFFGGFSASDVDTIANAIDSYPPEIHNPRADPQVPSELEPAGRDNPTSLQKHEDDEDRTVGSEWVFADQSGNKRRLDTRGLDLETTHYSPQGEGLELP